MPLEWREPDRDYRTFNAEVSGALDRSTAFSAFTDMWRCFFLQVAPLNRRDDWDQVRIEFWPDSGRCIVFVANSERVDRVDRGCCQLISQSLAATWSKFASIHANDDERFDRAIVEEEKRLIQFAVDAADEVAKGEPALRGLQVEFWNADSALLDSYSIG
jgi:hypothetical protein